MIIPPFADNSDIKFRGKGIRFTVPANTVFTYDHEIPYDLMSSGLDLLCHASIGDWVTVQAVDKNNVLGYGLNPAGIVLDEFAQEWNLIVDQYKAASVHLNYAAKLKQGLFLRFIYNNTSVTPVNVCVNAFRHKTAQPL